MDKKSRDPAAVLPLCVTGMIVCSVTLEVIYLIVHGPGNGHWALLMLASFLLFNVVGNMLKFVWSNPTIRGVFLEHGSVGQGWLYCYSCQTHVPPRCHHCYNCNVCVLRRDHHCTLLGQCVGYSNYRYFICSLFHGWLALLLATILNAEIFLELLHEGISFHSFFLLLMPWIMLVTGIASKSMGNHYGWVNLIYSILASWNTPNRGRRCLQRLLPLAEVLRGSLISGAATVGEVDEDGKNKKSQEKK